MFTTRTRARLAACATLAALGLAAAPAARAQTVAFTTTGGSLTGSPNGFTIGYSFTLANPVNVTKLGFFDSNGDGLSAAIPVTIYSTATGNAALASATIPAGTGTELNGYIFVTLATPVILPAATYVIGAYYAGNTDYALYNTTSVTGATGISYGDARRASGNAYPGTVVTAVSNAYFGPNFQTGAPAAAPEPSQFAAFGVGLLGLGALALRARKRQAA